MSVGRRRCTDHNSGIGRQGWVCLRALLALVGTLSHVGPAAARRDGIVTDSCNGCHGTGVETASLALVAEPEAFDPGDPVTFTLSIEDPSIRVGGVFITALGLGTFETLAAEGLGLTSNGLIHTTPKAAVDGAVTFRFVWQAPSTPGGVDFRVVALAANGDGSVRGDVAASGAFQWAFGCTAQTFYVDLDRDGHGAELLGVKLGCEGEPPPVGYASVSGDCNENNETVHPGATEVCNRKDDDCNGEVDENAPAVMLWPDDDGDGYYASRTGTPEVGCANLSGLAALGGDCDDTNPEAHPDATEVCNGRDDDCDGDVDDRVRPLCGVGWCARYSTSCDPEDCEPGAPVAETCNSFDDDCDGVNDNDACPPGTVCLELECVATGEEPATIPGLPVSVPGTASSSCGSPPPENPASPGTPASPGSPVHPQDPVFPQDPATTPSSAAASPSTTAVDAPGDGEPASGSDAGTAPGMVSPGETSSGAPAASADAQSGAMTEPGGCALASTRTSSVMRGMSHTAWLGLVAIAFGLCVRRLPRGYHAARGNTLTPAIPPTVS
jgi:Putative metal-binding motif